MPNLLKADQNSTLAELDYKKVLSRNYPYLRLNAGYGYTLNKYDINSIQRRNNWGFNGGITIGFNISMAIVNVKNAMQALLYEMPNLNANNWNKVYVPISAICGRHTVTIFAYSIWNVRT